MAAAPSDLKKEFKIKPLLGLLVSFSIEGAPEPNFVPALGFKPKVGVYFRFYGFRALEFRFIGFMV